MKIKVCHVVSGDLWAGAESMSYNLIKGLALRGDTEVTVIVLNRGGLLDRLCQCGVRVHLIEESRNTFREIAFKAAKVLAECTPDVVHAHRYKENLIAFVATRFGATKARLVTTLHGLPECGKREVLVERVKYVADALVVGRFFDMAVAVSEDIRRVMRERRSISAVRLEVIHNGIDLDEHLHARTSRQTVLISSAGRLFPVKDYALMVEVARRVAAQESRARFALAGDGPLIDELRSLVARYELDSVFEFRGFVADLTQFYSESDVYLNTSKHEGIPMSVLEAMSAGLPIVAPAVGGLPEVVQDGTEGFLVRDRSVDAFSAYCVRLVRDSRLRDQMGAAALNRVRKKFSTKVMVQNYFDLYSRTVSREGVQSVFQQIVRGAKRLVRRVTWHIAGLGVENPCVPNRTTKITFVCKGNICRSVFSHYLARQWALVQGWTGIEFDSGGLEVTGSLAPPENARVAARRFGISIDDSRSKPIAVEHAKVGEIFIAMEPTQLKRLRKAYPEMRDQFFLLPRFLGKDGYRYAAGSRSCVFDPYGRDLETFYECYEHIEACLEGMFDELGFRRSNGG